MWTRAWDGWEWTDGVSCDFLESWIADRVFANLLDGRVMNWIFGDVFANLFDGRVGDRVFANFLDGRLGRIYGVYTVDRPLR